MLIHSLASVCFDLLTLEIATLRTLPWLEEMSINMADPFGILGVIGVATQLIQMTVQFGLDWKDAPSDARAFFFELQSLRTVLQETHKNVTLNPDFVNTFEGRHSTILSHLGDQSQETAAKSTLSACEVELE